MPSGTFSRLRSVRSSRPAATSSTMHIAICAATTMRPKRDLCLSCAAAVPELFSASPAGTDKALRSGASPKIKAASTSIREGEQQDRAIRLQAGLQLRPRSQGPRGRHCEQPGQDSACDHQQQALGQELAKQVHATGADGQPQAELALAGLVARDQQQRDIRAGDQQHQSNQAHQQAQVAVDNRPRRRQVLSPESKTAVVFSSPDFRLSTPM